MLPLSIYLSAEFSILDLKTLYRAFESYMFMPDGELEEALEDALLQPHLEQSIELPELAQVDLWEPIDPNEANRTHRVKRW